MFLTREDEMDVIAEKKSRLTEKARHMGAENTNLHITGLMVMKGKKYIASKDEDRIPLAPALIKTPS